MSVRMEYDQNGRITSQIFADGKSWSYTYLEKVRNVGGVMMPTWCTCIRCHVIQINFEASHNKYDDNACRAEVKS